MAENGVCLAGQIQKYVAVIADSDENAPLLPTFFEGGVGETVLLLRFDSRELIAAICRRKLIVGHISRNVISRH